MSYPTNLREAVAYLGSHPRVCIFTWHRGESAKVAFDFVGQEPGALRFRLPSSEDNPWREDIPDMLLELRPEGGWEAALDFRRGGFYWRRGKWTIFVRYCKSD